MPTPTTKRLTRSQVDRKTSDRGALGGRLSVRTITLFVLGVTVLFVLVAVLATVRLSYRPYEGC